MNLPRFNLGDKVRFTVSGTVENVVVTGCTEAYVHDISLESGGDEGTKVFYGLMPDSPLPYTTFSVKWRRREDQLTLVERGPFKP